MFCVSVVFLSHRLCVYVCGCAQPCRLHLHSVTEKYRAAHVFSAASARGLLIGLGNVGDYLRPFAHADTFLSRDAGVTWTQAARGRSVYEFGNHGTILLLAERDVHSNALMYSLDSGTTWCRLALADSRDSYLRIRDMITEPSATKRTFLLIGTRVRETISSIVEEPVVISLDFSAVYARACDLSSDFEPWSLSDDHHRGVCHMGHNVSLSIDAEDTSPIDLGQTLVGALTMWLVCARITMCLCLCLCFSVKSGGRWIVVTVLRSRVLITVCFVC
jgi:hypothetical protein